jgi:hypothetical protein
MEQQKALMAAEQVDDVIAAIEDAFRKSGLQCDLNDAALRGTINVLAALTIVQPSPDSARKVVGRVAAEKQIGNLVKTAALLHGQLRTLSATAIDALGGSHVEVAIEQKMKWLRDLVDAARAAKVVAGRGRGSSKNRRAHYAASVVINAFEKLAACTADQSSRDRPRGLEPLIRKIFAALNIDADPKAAIEAALRERARQMPAPALTAKSNSAADSAAELFERIQRTELAERSPKFWKA